MLESWKQFVEGQPVGVFPERPILESWDRCKAFDVTTARAHFRRLPLPELRERLTREAPLVEAAKKHLVWALAALEAFRPVIVILTDADGVVLHSVGNAPEAMAEFGLVPGYDWSERAMGTNGIGTAIAYGAPVAVVGPEHYVQTWHNNTCVGAPVRGPDGRIRGAVDISTTATDGDPARLVLVAFLAHVIGLELGAASTRSYATDDLLDRASAAGSSGGRSELAEGARALAMFEDDLRCRDGATAGATRDSATLDHLLEAVAERAGARFVGLGAGAPRRLELGAAPLFQRALAHLATILGRRGGSEVEITATGDAASLVVRIQTNAAVDSSPNNLERAGDALGEWLAKELLAVSAATVARADAEGRTGYAVRIPVAP